jgi:hypothetical protein
MQRSYKRSMHHALICHPDTPCSAVSAITVAVTRGRGGQLNLHYTVSGNPRLLRPSPERVFHGRRADDLWLHTCFEAFVRPAGGEAYVECNLAPTRDWQAYALSGYRRDRQPAETITKPEVESELGNGVYDLKVTWVLGEAESDAPWQIGIAVVVEESNGAISYWALRHAPDKPDFHHGDAFALTVAP